jgi:hypothetical protein
MSDPAESVDAAATEQLQSATKLIEGFAKFATQLAQINVKRKTVQHKIDGLCYTSTKFAASTGLEIWPRITALLGAAFTRSIATGDMGGVTADVFVRVADRAMTDGLVPLVRDLMQRLKVDVLDGDTGGGDVLDQFDEHFAGEYGHLLRVCAFVIAHNLRGPTLGGS